jgi:flagellar protein FlaG
MNVGSVEMSSTSAIPSAAASLPRQEVAHPVQAESVTDSRQVRKMVVEMQDHIDKMNVSLSFTTYGENGQKIAVSVIDKDTGKVIREIPAKEIQSLYTKMSELAGMIFNTEA